MPHSARTDISAFVICKDEVETIGRCLESLAFCSEIFVVDSGSTDGTLETVRTLQARGLPIKLMERSWPGYALQKQFAMDATCNLWCLSMDADEYVDQTLREAILSLDLHNSPMSGFWMRRRDHLPGYGYPPAIVHARYLLRLVRKDRARFDLTQLVHEALFADGPTQRMKRGLIMHYRNMSVGEESARLNRYSTLKAHDKHARGKKTTPLRLVFLAIGEFVKTYFGQRYFACGNAGIIHAMQRAEYALLTEAKLHRLKLGDKVPPEE